MSLRASLFVRLSLSLCLSLCLCGLVLSLEVLEKIIKLEVQDYHYNFSENSDLYAHIVILFKAVNGQMGRR
jgi:hypothetical protein